MALVESAPAALSALSLRHDPKPLPVLEDRKPEINVLLSVQRTQALSEPYQHETIQAFPNDTVKDLKLRLRNRGWYKHGQWVMVFGNRELLESETVGQVVRRQSNAGESTGNYLHIFVKLSDIDGVKITSMTRKLSFGQLAEAAHTPDAVSSPKSALTSALLGSTEPDNSRALIPLPGAGASSAVATVEDNSQAVIHLMIRKSAKVSWHHTSGDCFELSVSTSTTPDTVKRMIEASHGSISAYKHELVCNGRVLKGGKSLSEYGVGKDTVLELVPFEPNLPGDNYPDGSPMLKSPAHELFNNWQKAQEGLLGGHTPKLASAGAGGSYFLEDSQGQNVAVFKPQDEEPNAVNNPRGLVTSASGEGLRKGTRAGEGAVREVAAYILDHNHFANVPPTALVNCKLAVSPPNSPPANSLILGSETVSPPVAKLGSLQQFVVAEFDCEERGTSSFPASEVHKIAVLDIRLANTDRNGSNMLARRSSTDGSWQLIPIDHGYILPATLEDINFEWLFWPQAKVPFDESTKEYISRLDAEKDVQLLAAHHLQLRPECLRVLRVCTMLLKKGTVRGLSPYKIGCIMSRQAFTMSPLEKLHHHALHLAASEGALSSGITTKPHGRVASGQFVEEVYLGHMSRLLDEFLEEFLLDDEDDLF